MLIYLSLLEEQEDKDLFSELYDTYRYTMLSVARRYCHDQFLAEDVVHEVFLKIIDNLDKFKQISCSKTKGLIVLLVRNKTYDILRRQKTIPMLPMDEFETVLEDKTPSAFEQMMERQDFERLIQSIGKLRDIYKNALELKYVYNYSDAETAQLLDITPKNLSVRLSRAKEMLKEILNEEKCECEQ